MERTVTCKVCRAEKPFTRDFFEVNARAPEGLTNRCRDCNYVRHRAGSLAFYGLTHESFQKILDFQGGACRICKTDKPGGRGSFCVDHKHVDGWDKMLPKERRTHIRALLCHQCNIRLGQLELLRSDIEWTNAAVEYLGIRASDINRNGFYFSVDRRKGGQRHIVQWRESGKRYSKSFATKELALDFLAFIKSGSPMFLLRPDLSPRFSDEEDAEEEAA